jgi:GNAT superfamily N-acetyltransferase
LFTGSVFAHCNFSDPDLSAEVLKLDEFQKDQAWWKIFETSFPEMERPPNEKLILDYKKSGKAMRVQHKLQTIALGYFYILQDIPASYMVFIAVDPQWRNNGIGTEFFHCFQTEMSDHVEEAHKKETLGSIWEVEIPDEPEIKETEKQTRERRIGFYEKQGADVLDRSYLAPMRDGSLAPLWLMGKSFHPNSPALPIEKVIPEIYRIWDFKK